MKATEGQIGRVFILQLEDRDIVPECIEKFAKDKEITVGHVILIGGIEKGNVIAGPRKSRENPPEPMEFSVDGTHEVLAAGVIAPTAEGKPVLHIHGSLGRSGQTITGCLRKGVSVWHIAEVVIYEILNTNVKRLYDKETGFTLLNIE